jgi:hypothetical protein
MRITAGFTQDADFQPLGLIGTPDPFFYATFADDFMPYDANNYTVTVTGNGTVAGTTGGNGGRITLTTDSTTATAAAIAEIQLPTANVVMSATKKTAFLARLQSAQATIPAQQLGLMQETATPATITNGMVAFRAHAATGWTFAVYVSSTNVGSVVVTDTVSGWTANTDMDIAMVYNGKSASGSGNAVGDVLVYMGAGLVGQQLNQNTANLGPITRFTPTAIPTVAISLTAAIQSGTTTNSTTAIYDFIYAAQER